MINEYFVAHPAEKNMTYYQHLKRAWFFGWNLIKAGGALIIHGIVPKYFPDTGSNTIKEMYILMNHDSINK